MKPVYEVSVMHCEEYFSWTEVKYLERLIVCMWSIHCLNIPDDKLLIEEMTFVNTTILINYSSVYVGWTKANISLNP